MSLILFVRSILNFENNTHKLRPDMEIRYKSKIYNILQTFKNNSKILNKVTLFTYKNILWIVMFMKEYTGLEVSVLFYCQSSASGMFF